MICFLIIIELFLISLSESFNPLILPSGFPLRRQNSEFHSSTVQTESESTSDGELWKGVIDARNILLEAANTRSADAERVVDNILFLERKMRLINNSDGGKTASNTFSSLDGTWRLIFTT